MCTSLCPAGTSVFDGYCLAYAANCTDTAATTCGNHGLTVGPGSLNVTWNAAAETAAAAGFGFTVAAGGCCATALWCDPVNKQCFTDGFGSQLVDWAGSCIMRGANNGHGVVICNPL
jgi:hypothetical protein